ncbi:ACP phosphodiesterase [Candidatus Sulfidibacterium hydrothermale]|uniref:acyl carrier protein phosphodiesterase n=1 Tax=Candidatus Sulfidibacterium hydrothermale TaxID=2875962 RepID=UPI001F0B6AC5|nr:ACP phosphodiesterase [Candidatus Sulfidibacterium hydrothermale]UBM63048.1 ACP phosphodiesterase [Candidatus Sulfidibacterium hydrothermale]
MNFLAHAHLSGDDDKILTGNLIADAVKGNQWKNYSSKIQNGILLHRVIDDFTDKHPLVKQSRVILRPYFGLYSGVVIDLYFDHFLSVNWSAYSSGQLVDFTRHIYRVLGKNFFLLPARIKRIIPFMIAQNWLHSYASPVELEKIFYNMDRRTGFRSGMKNALPVLQEHYDQLQKNFNTFYPLLENRVKETGYTLPAD